MRTLPHIVIGCGAVWAGCRLLRSAAPQPPRMSEGHRASVSHTDNGREGDSENPVMAIDYRLVAFGSVLPDMIDRVQRAAVGPRSGSKEQHLLGHTLLLNLPLVFAGAQLARRGDWRLLAVGAAAVTHLLADPVVRSPRTLFWPLLGLRFPEAPGLGKGLTVLSQIAAGGVAVSTIIRLQKQGRLQRLLSSGRL